MESDEEIVTSNTYKRFLAMMFVIPVRVLNKLLPLPWGFIDIKTNTATYC